MTLRTVAIPDPVAGADFSTVVPGRYLYDITGITATLDTGSPTLDVMHDSSGNGRDGTYTTVGGYPIPAPGIIAGDGAMQTGDPSILAPAGGGNTPAMGFDIFGDLTIEFWFIPPFPATQEGLVAYWSDGAGHEVWFGVGGGVDAGFNRQDGFTSQSFTWDTTAFADDGNAHGYVLVYEAGVATLYIDTVIVPPTITDPFVAYPPVDTPASVFQFARSITGVNGTVDELAFYPYALSQAQIDAHDAAASGGITTYAPAVLADSPAAYYHLDETVGGGARQVCLVVATSTGTVADICSGFPLASGAGPYVYSWQPNLASGSQTPDGGVTTIPLPRLILPAGYSVGSFTLDLGVADQWSAITLWWDDAQMLAGVDVNPYVYPPGVKLVYRPTGATP